MKTAHSQRVPHHSGLHVGSVKFEWGSLVIPLLAFALLFLLIYLVVGQPPEATLPTILDPSVAQ